MDEGGIDAAVIHPPEWDPGATELALQAARDYPGRFAVMGSLPLDQPNSCARIAGWRQQPCMLALRYIFLRDPARQWLADGTIDWLWAEAEKASVPIYMIATDSLADVARIAERYPGLRLTIGYLGGRGGITLLQDHAAMPHMPALLALAKYPNVAVAATGGSSDHPSNGLIVEFATHYLYACDTEHIADPSIRLFQHNQWKADSSARDQRRASW